MKCPVTYATGMYSKLSTISSEIYIFNLGYLSSGLSIYVSKDVRIHDYVLKKKGVREQKKYGKHRERPITSVIMCT